MNKLLAILTIIAAISVGTAYLVLVGLPTSPDSTFELGTLHQKIIIYYTDSTTETLDSFTTTMGIVYPVRNGKTIDRISYIIEGKSKNVATKDISIDFRNFFVKYELYRGAEKIIESPVFMGDIYSIRIFPSDSISHELINQGISGFQNGLTISDEYTMKFIPWGSLQYKDGTYVWGEETGWVQTTSIPGPIEFKINMIVSPGVPP